MAELTLMAEKAGGRLSAERPRPLRRVNELMREGRRGPAEQSGSRFAANASRPSAASRSG
jgi:hypothetical protein